MKAVARLVGKVTLGLGGLAVVACGGALTTRTVEEPMSEVVTYGAPKNTTYIAELDAMREQARITVFRKSECDVIPVTVVRRVEEKRRGDKTVERRPVGRGQVAGSPTGTVPCDQGYANRVDVMLQVADGGRFPLGVTDAHGQVTADLAQLFQAGSYEQVPETASVMLRPAQGQPLVGAGVVDLSQLQQQQGRLQVMLAELEGLVSKTPEQVTPADLARSYELYAQLSTVAAEDPRVVGLRTRFWELFYQRKVEQAREALGKNLDALTKAKELLIGAGDAAIPIYLQAAINGGTLDRRSLEWSSLRLLRALRGAPTICSAGFSWSQLSSYGWPRDAVLAAQYVQFAYGDGHQAAIQASCRAF